MKTAVEELSPTRVKLTVEVPFDELRPSLDAAYKKVAQQVRVPGFRPGKVPARIIEQRFGRAVVLEETLNDAVPKLYGQAVDEVDVFPVSQPDIEVTKIEDGEQIEFTAEVDIRPNFDVPDYQGIEVTRRLRRGHRRGHRHPARRAAPAVRHADRRRAPGRERRLRRDGPARPRSTARTSRSSRPARSPTRSAPAPCCRASTTRSRACPRARRRPSAPSSSAARTPARRPT